MTSRRTRSAALGVAGRSRGLRKMQPLSWPNGAKATVRFQSQPTWPSIDRGSRRPGPPGARRVSQRWKPVAEPLGPVAEPRAVHQAALEAGVAEQAVDVDQRLARAEAVVRDGDDRRVAPRGQLQQPADALVEGAEAALDLLVPARLADAGLVDVEIGPEPVLEAVEVVEVDHQGRPVGAGVGPLGGVGLGAEDRAVPRGLRPELVERPRPVLPDDLVREVGDVGEDLGAELGALGERPVEAGGVGAGDDQAADPRAAGRSSAGSG